MKPNLKEYTGFAVAIAWPETYCKQPGSWYDDLVNLLGISKNHYYKVGHAALVLINSETNTCHYFDFGRYHAPFQYGRVRSAITDHGLEINTTAKISENGQKIENFTEILTEIQLNEECHGEGKLHASYCKVNFEEAYQKAFRLQQKSPILYGPFQYQGTNCSRFVSSCIVAGKPKREAIIRLKYLVFLTPTPINNVNSLQNKVVIPKFLNTYAFCPKPITNRRKLKITLEQPSKNEKIPDDAKWLSGEGSGSWFSIRQHIKHYQINRYDPKGGLECRGIFKVFNDSCFDINLPFEMEHLSHCQRVVVIQSEKRIAFERLADES